MRRNRLAPAQLDRARRLLAREAAAATAEASPLTAASRVYDKLHARLTLLLGDAGVQALFVRSAKLAEGDLARFAALSVLEGSQKLRERLQARDPALDSESAEILFGHFLSVISTFIGERLTIQLLRNEWPLIDETAAGEKKK